MKRLLLLLVLCIGYGNLIYQCNIGDSKACAELTHVSEQDCGKGGARGCYNAAISYAEGKGVRADFNKAMGFFGKACDLGMQKGCEELMRQNAQQIQHVADYKHPMFHTKQDIYHSQEIAQLRDMGLGISLFVASLLVIFGALYYIDKNIRVGFVDTIFRKITIPQGKTAQIIAAIVIGFQILAAIGFSLATLSAPFETAHSGLFLFAVTLVNLVDVVLMVLCVYFYINFLYRYRAFWLYLVCFGLNGGVMKIAESLNLWWLFFVGSVIVYFLQITMIFHYNWYRKNKDTLGTSQNNLNDEPNVEDMLDKLIVGFIFNNYTESELIRALQILGVQKAQIDAILPRLITDKLLYNRILSGASEMADDSLNMAAIAVSVADQVNQYLRGEIDTIPKELSSLVAIADKESFWRIHKTLLYVWIVEKGKQNLNSMDDAEQSMFFSAFICLYGQSALEEFLRQKG